jgi:hypothetical protein
MLDVCLRFEDSSLEQLRRMLGPDMSRWPSSTVRVAIGEAVLFSRVSAVMLAGEDVQLELEVDEAHTLSPLLRRAAR